MSSGGPGGIGGAEVRRTEHRTGPPLDRAYVLAFLAYAIVYSAVLLTTGAVTVARAAIGGVANVLPQALLGLAAIALCRRLPLAAARTARFTALHLGAALVYAATCTLLTALCFNAWRWFETGEFEFRVLDHRILVWQAFESMLVYAILASLAYSVASVRRLRIEQANAAAAAELRVRAELRALQAQLNPHFLFNTLHTLLALVRQSPRAAEEAIEQVGDLMHYVLRSGGEDQIEVGLAEELDFVRNYLALEQLRLGDRLRVRQEIDRAALACALPALTLQPLVENAIRHGLAPRAAGGTLSITARVAGGELAIEVADDGIGAQPDRPLATNGRGLHLVRQRLLALHGAAARLEVETAPGKGFRVRVALPAIGANDAIAEVDR